MNIALPVNGLIRDFYHGLKLIRVVEDDSYNQSEEFNPYEYIQIIKDNNQFDDFIINYSEDVFNSRVSLVNQKVGISLVKFLHWARDNSHTITLTTDEEGTTQIHTLQLLVMLGEGSFTLFDNIDFQFNKARLGNFDLVYTDVPSFAGLGTHIYHIETPYTEDIAVKGLHNFEAVKEHIIKHGKRAESVLGDQ